jgi:uncharacterized RDD family membrane protein YckC
MAYIIDFALIIMYSVVAGGVMATIDSMTGTGLDDQEWIAVTVIGLPSILYRLVAEVTWNGQTVGKWVLGIRVVKIDGTRSRFNSYLLRWMIGLIEIPISSGAVALVVILLNGKGQRLGDIAGGTCVIQKRKKVKLDDTLFEEVEQKYDVTFPQAVELSDEDVAVIREVLKARKDYDESTWFVMLQRTRKVIEEKLGLERNEMNAPDFLQTLIKDYNALHFEGATGNDQSRI